MSLNKQVVKELYPGAEHLIFEPMLISKATDSQLQKASESGEYFAQLKKDGALYIFIKGYNGKCYLFGRTKSKKTGVLTEKSENVPHIIDYLNKLVPNGTVLLGEIYYPNGTSRNVTSIMGCLPQKAIERQEGDYGFIHYYIYDCLAYNNISLLKVDNYTRYQVLLKILEKTEEVDYIDLAVAWIDNIYEMVGKALSAGEEGMVFKKKDALYEPGKRPKTNLKAKQVDFIDAVVMGFCDPVMEYTGKDLVNWTYWIDPTTMEFYPEGLHYQKSLDEKRGKYYMPVTKPFYYHWYNAIEIGAYNNQGCLISIGTIASGLTDQLRADFAKNSNKYLNKVVQIQCMSKDSENKTLRHGFFMGFRDDKDATDCKLEEIF